jgi:hypothetical protein
MKILDEVAGGIDTLLPEGSLKMEIIHVGFYRHGEEITGVEREHQRLFLSAPDNAEVIRTGQQSCQQVFRPLPEHLFTLSNVLVSELSLRSAGESVDWHRVLTEGNFPSSGREFSDSLQSAIDKGFVRYVFDIVPNTWPTFLPS